MAGDGGLSAFVDDVLRWHLQNLRLRKYLGRSRDAPVNRLVKQVEEITPATEATARLAGSLLGSAGRNATMDALVVAEAALWRNAVILTTDAKDLSALAADLTGVRVLAV